MTRQLEILLAMAENTELTLSTEECAFVESYILLANENDRNCFPVAVFERIASERQAWLDRAISKLPIGQ